MLFNSVEYLFFLPTVVLLYFLTPARYRWIVLLAVSYYFYMCWKAEYIVLILASTLIDYFAGIRMGKEKIKSKRKKYLILSFISNLGLLFSFKYFNFFSDSVGLVFESFNIFYETPSFGLLLPVGISFYTFQTLSYTIDVYNEKRSPEKHLGIFALYVSFFPQLVAGPIERSTTLLPQFRKAYKFEYQRVGEGLKLILLGLFKKLVVADRLAIIVDHVYNNPESQSGFGFVTASFFFAFQIFCDFSGYSDIAIGSAKIMGYDLMENFRRPYYSKSISEFWKRWHISLSTWFKDYFYIPIGGNRVVKWRWYYNLLATFIVSGLWHGANWTFIIWGALHGFYLIMAIMSAKYLLKFNKLLGIDKMPRLRDLMNIAATFILVDFAWIFFRANSIGDAFYIVQNLFSRGNISIKMLGVSYYELAVTLLSILVLELVQLSQRNHSTKKLFAHKPLFVRWLAYMSLILFIILFGVFESNQFIYFQF